MFAAVFHLVYYYQVLFCLQNGLFLFHAIAASPHNPAVPGARVCPVQYRACRVKKCPAAYRCCVAAAAAATAVCCCCCCCFFLCFCFYFFTAAACCAVTDRAITLTRHGARGGPTLSLLANAMVIAVLRADGLRAPIYLPGTFLTSPFYVYTCIRDMQVLLHAVDQNKMRVRVSRSIFTYHNNRGIITFPL